jgi:hypothetical protein
MHGTHGFSVMFSYASAGDYAAPKFASKLLLHDVMMLSCS